MISKKIITSIVLLIFFFGAIATGIVFYITQKTLVDNKKEDLTSNLISQTHDIRQIFNMSSELVLTISNQQMVRDYFVHKNDVLDLLNSYNINNNYSAIYLIDIKGEAVVSTDPTFVGKNYAFRDYFKRSIGGDNYTDVSIGSTSGLLGYYFSSPIKSTDGITVGVAVVKLKPEIVGRTLLEHTNLFKSLSLVDNYGVVVISSDQTRVYKSLGKLSDSTKQEIFATKRYADVEINALGYQEIQNQIGLVDSISLDITDKEDGDEKEMVTMAVVHGYPFYVVGEILTDNILNQSLRSSILLSIIVLASALFAALLITIIIRRILDPLNILKKASDDIKNKVLVGEININSNDEFQELAESLNGMIKSVNISNQDLETKVNERTRDLKKINDLMVGRELKMMELKERIKKYEN